MMRGDRRGRSGDCERGLRGSVRGEEPWEEAGARGLPDGGVTMDTASPTGVCVSLFTSISMVTTKHKHFVKMLSIN